MLLTPHTIVGITVASTIQQPYIAAPLAFLLHFAGDFLPHWDFYTDTTKEQKVMGWRPLAVMLDFGVAIAIGLTATLYALWVLNDINYASNIFLCGIASVLPDALTGPSIYMKNAPGFFKLIHNFQRKINNSASLVYGVATQIAVVLVCFFLLAS